MAAVRMGMDADIAYADCALDAWASWVKGALGAWPSLTLLGRIIEQGANGAAQLSRSMETMPEHILQTDKAVAKLDQYEKPVVMVYYLLYLDSDEKAKAIGISRMTFWRRLKRGQKSVYHALASDTAEGHIHAR